MANKSNKKSLLEILGESQVWKSIIRSGVPRTKGSVCMQFLFPSLTSCSASETCSKVGYTWCMGGLSFSLC